MQAHDLNLQESDYCERCGKPSVSKRAVPVLHLTVDADNHVTDHRTVMEGRGMCVEHRIAYQEDMQAQQQAEVQKAYEDYIKWCEKCDYKPKSFDIWDHDRKVTSKGKR